jgi:replicative DNA helicase
MSETVDYFPGMTEAEFESGPGMPSPISTDRASKPTEPILASFEAEEAVLASIFLDPKAIAHVQGVLTPSSFFFAPHRILWEIMVAITSSDTVLDHITLRNALVARQVLDEIGGLSKLVDLMDAVMTSTGIEAHAAIVADLKARRDSLSVLEASALAMKDRSRSIGGLMSDAVDGLLRAAPVEINADEPIRKSLAEAIDEIELRWRMGERVVGMPSGIATLDHVTLGFKTSELWVVAARPSMGKTAFMVNTARYLAGLAGVYVAIFSLEMSKIRIMQRFLSAEGNVDLPETYGNDKARDLGAPSIFSAASKMQAWPILLDDRPSLNAAQIRFQVDRWTRDVGQAPGLVMVDYLGLMGDRDPQGYDRSDQRIGARVRDLRQLLCKALGIPLVLLHQLSRESVKGERPRRPRLSDLRDSGEIEQHADGVVFLHPTGEDGGHAFDGRAEAIVAKHRDGPTGIAEIKFRRETGRMSAWRRDGRGEE